jgi:hypothetical protein
VAFTLNFLFLRKKQGLKLNVVKLFGKNFISAVACGLGAFGVYKAVAVAFPTVSRINCLLCLAPAGITAVLIYVALTLVLKGATAEEIELLPKGRTLAAFLKGKNLL